MDLDLFFFPAFFEFMIFTDVFLLIISLPFFERYEYLIRNAGFVISTVLLRFSLSTPKPYDLAVGLVAMLYGLCVLAVFAYFTRVASESDDDDSSTHGEVKAAKRDAPRTGFAADMQAVQEGCPPAKATSGIIRGRGHV
jgi:hypothetical protein